MPSNRGVQVKTAKGTISGFIEEDISVFKGIPYAKPPIGNLRWRAPEEIELDGRPAIQRGPSCFQNQELCTDIGGGDPTPPKLSEDCLYLNIWTPQLEATAKLPVMVWIHGGGYVIGAGDLPPYVGTPLAKRGAVVVNINYRLGHLGFFAHPALDDEAKRERREPVNNFALLDQIAALKWIKNNIQYFGGDKDNVTIFGQSAGGRSVLSLFASPKAKDQGLFHKGVAQSVYGLPDMSRDEALERGEAFANYFKIGGSADVAAELRKLDANLFWQIAPEAGKAAFGGPVPIYGDSVLEEPLLEVFEAGDQAPLPLIIGNNSDDSSVLRDFGFGPEDVIKILKNTPAPPPAETDLYTYLKNSLYQGVSPDEEFGRQVGRDLLFTTMSFFIVKSHYNAGAPSWRYHFDYVAKMSRPIFLKTGARHGDEVPYVLGTVDTAPPPGQEITEPDVQFAQKVSEYWLEFAKSASSSSGSIAPPGHVAWPKHEPASVDPPKFNKTMGFGENGVEKINVIVNFKIAIVNGFEETLKDLENLIPKSQRVHSYEGAVEPTLRKKTA